MRIICSALVHTVPLCPVWPILCRVWRKTLTQSTAISPPLFEGWFPYISYLLHICFATVLNENVLQNVFCTSCTVTTNSKCSCFTSTLLWLSHLRIGDFQARPYVHDVWYELCVYMEVCVLQVMMCRAFWGEWSSCCLASLISRHFVTCLTTDYFGTSRSDCPSIHRSLSVQ